MDDALRKRLDAVIALLAVIAALLALVLVAVGGGGLLALGVTLAFVSIPVGHAILTEAVDEESGSATGAADEE